MTFWINHGLMGGRKRKPWPCVGLIEDSILIAQCIASTHFSKILAGVDISYIQIYIYIGSSWLLFVCHRA